ncbi:MAG: thiamine pyrophosphate-dependent dehydrogenase E1 component subunit alpha [Acidobacteria bacterium]|nr:thiamine pyrophosphate-dependent dehydrogenase E1 component subunit alpha [Acidobacteriota bacterium]
MKDLAASKTSVIMQSSETLLELRRTMVRIRAFEEELVHVLERGEIALPVHLCIGQEAVPAGVCAALESSDIIWGAHRSHGHYIAKGADPKAMMAEIFGRVEGCSGGRGGSMHLLAREQGVLGTVPIVAATVSLAVGSALAAKLRKQRAVTVAFFGDGAVEEGQVHESLNLAALFRLPIVFICENNFLATHMHLSERRVHDNLYQAGEFHGVPGIREDGNDVLAVYEAATQAIERARNGNGPTFIEFRTYRWRGHVGKSFDLDVGLNRKDDLEEWMAKDPLKRTRLQLLESGTPEVVLLAIEKAAREEAAEAVCFARTSRMPDPQRVIQHVFVEANPRSILCEN